MGVKKSLKKVFAVFLLKTIAGLVLAVCIPVLIFCVLVITGQVNLANISEKETYAAVEEIKKTGETDIILNQLSNQIKYIKLNQKNQVIATSMSKQEEEAALAYLQKETFFDNGVKRYVKLEQGKEKIVLYYRVETYFTNAYLDAVLPSPEIVFLFIVLIGIIVNFVLQVNRLEWVFRKELNPILKATGEIGKQNLDYEMKPSKIKEFDEIQNALTDMKTELTQSFQKQWDMQRTQQEQIAALAHDLKTPMTVTMGNLDLLSETDLEEEQGEFVDAAIDGLVNMEKYLQTLMDMAVSSIQYKYQFQNFSLAEFERKIVKQSKALCQAKKIDFSYEHLSEKTEYLGDEEMLERAVMNLIRNAVEYTPVKGRIAFRVLTKDNYLCVQVCDSGSGFSEKMLRQGAELFSMEDNSRKVRLPWIW